MENCHGTLLEKSSLAREALKALVERASGRRLARLGGSEPDLKTPATVAGAGVICRQSWRDT
jgi:hypothetical protein